MTCNARHHPENCNCGFGGSPRERTPKWHKDRATALRSTDHPNSTCGECKSRIHFVQSKNGGAVYLDRLGPPWPKHQCKDAAFRRGMAAQEVGPDGWILLVITNTEQFGIGTIVHGIAVADEGLVSFGAAHKLELDHSLPCSFKKSANGRADFSYLDPDTLEASVIDVFYDCANALELLERMNSL